MIHKTGEGRYVISSRGVWMPGCYADEGTARYAFRFPDEALQRLQDDANARAGGTGSVITWGDLAREASNLRAAQTTSQQGGEHG